MFRARYLLQLLTTLTLTLFLFKGEPSLALAQALPGQEQPQTHYELVDEWGGKAWHKQPGSFDRWTDVTSTPDGTRWILDEPHRLVHVRSADGQAWDSLPLPTWVADADGIRRAMSYWRIDASPSGEVGVLGVWYDTLRGQTARREDYRYAVLVLEDGQTWRVRHRARLTGDWFYSDVSLGPDRQTYLTRYDPADTAEQGSIDVFAPLDEEPSRPPRTIAPPELGHPYRVDVNGDGAIYMIGRRCKCSPKPTPLPSATPSPAPTLPSFASRSTPTAHRSRARGGPVSLRQQPTTFDTSASIDSMTQDGEGVQGLVVIGPDGQTIDTWPMWPPADVAVSEAGAIVVSGTTVSDADTRRLLLDLSSHYPVGVQLEAADLSRDGRITLANSNSSYYGLFELDYDAPSRVTPLGMHDLPRLRGPYWPRSLAVDRQRAEAYVIDHQVEIGTTIHRMGGPKHVRTEPAALHRWRLDGTLAGQNGILWYGHRAEERPLDVTAVGGAMVSITHRELMRRPDTVLPSWVRTYDDSGIQTRASHFTAVDGDGNRIAVLDVGRERVLWLNDAGDVITEWSTWTDLPNALPSDLAVDGQLIYLADRGRNRIMVRDADGLDLGEWPTHDGPLRIAVGPEGDVFVLGRGGWLLRYGPAGELRSWWRLGLRDVRGVLRAATPGDLDVDAEGLVYVSWWVERLKDTIEVGHVGVSVFAPGERQEAEARRPLEPGACLVTPEKQAAPGRVRLGEQVEVTLRLNGTCPGTHRPSQIVIVLDRSRSMTWDGALLRAREAMVDLLDTLNGEAVEIGLVSFADGAALEVPLTDRLGDIRGRLATLEAGGDTRMEAGIDLARRELLGERRDPGAEPHIWIVSDGVFKDQPTQAVQAATGAGIIVDALVFRTNEFDNDTREAMRGLVGAGHLHEELRPHRDVAAVQQITAYDPKLGLFGEVEINDVIPANMRLVESSVQPPAAQPEAQTLRWSFEDVVASDPITLTYLLEPLEIGTHPTNVKAEAQWVDAWGHRGQVDFPVPQIEVRSPPPTATPSPTPAPAIYVPFAARNRCHRRQPLDIVLAVDTSGSMGRPAPGGSGTALDVARQAMRSFVGRLDMPRDRVALVEFNATARALTGLTGDTASIHQAIDDLRHSPGSRLDQGLALAAHALDTAPKPRGRPVVILLTDGQQYDSRKLAFAWGDAMRGRGVTVYAVGFGPTLDEELLRRLVTTPDRYQRSKGADDLLPIYDRIGARLACPGG